LLSDPIHFNDIERVELARNIFSPAKYIRAKHAPQDIKESRRHGTLTKVNKSA
jgi:hypothetical protein